MKKILAAVLFLAVMAAPAAFGQGHYRHHHHHHHHHHHPSA